MAAVKFKISVSFFTLLLTVPNAFAALTVDFNAPGELENRFSVEADSGTAVQDGAVGFDGSGGVDLSTTTRNHGFVVPTSFSGDQTTWSSSVLWRAPESGTAFTLGFTSQPNANFSGTSPALVQDTADLSEALNSVYAEFGLNGQLIQSVITDDSTTEQALDFHSLTADEWYHSAIQVTYNGSNSYTVQAETSNIDSSGAATSVITASSATFDHSNLAADGEAFTYFGVHTADAAAIDEFTTTAVVPEPGVWMVALMGAACTMVRRRREGRN